MPSINIPFPDPINTSVQVGDMIYAVPTLPAGTAADTFRVETLRSALEIGEVWRINNQEGLDTSILPSLDVLQTTTPPNTPAIGEFIMFSKNKAVNTSGIIGYYAEVTLKNYSISDVELFSIAAGVAISSS